MVHEGLIAIAEKEREVTYSGQREICRYRYIAHRSTQRNRRTTMNLATDYLHLSSPIIPSAGPLTENLDSVKRMEDAGRLSHRVSLSFRRATPSRTTRLFSQLDQGTESFAEPLP